jgi:hypothetical protein
MLVWAIKICMTLSYSHLKENDPKSKIVLFEYVNLRKKYRILTMIQSKKEGNIMKR